jgi:CheY-like chemotaxis protein
MSMPRIIIVDDSPDVLNIAKRILEKKKHEVVTVDNAIEGMDKLLTYPFDILILDLNMPDVDGIELLTRIRMNPKFENLGIAICSGKVEGHEAEIEALNVNTYINKPINPKDINSKIKKLMAEKPKDESEARESFPAYIVFYAEVTSIMDQYLTIVTNYNCKKGDDLNLSCELLNEMGLENPTFKVESVDVLDDDQKSVKLLFSTLSEADVGRIHTYCQNFQAQYV